MIGRSKTKKAAEEAYDIVLRGAEGSIVGVIPGLRGREAVECVIDFLLARRK